MKQLWKNMIMEKFKILFFGFILSVNFVFAETTIGIVSELKGESAQAFIYSQSGKMKLLKTGDPLVDNSQILVEVGSELIFKFKSNGSLYHLTGGSQVSLSESGVSLVRGTLWTNSRHERMEMKTPNSLVVYGASEFILSYDPAIEKTQILTLKGETKFSHFQNELAYVQVPSGTISVLDKDGLRAPTIVGQNSLKETLALFQGVALNKRSHIGEIAKSENNKPLNKIIFIESKEVGRKVASVEEVPTLKKQKKVVYKKELKEVPIKVYGQAYKKADKKEQVIKREIASVKAIEENFFEKTLEEENLKQLRHSDTRLELIRELKNVNSQFLEDY